MNVGISMQEYMDLIIPIEVSYQRRRDSSAKCTAEEKSSYLALAGQLNWLGHGVLPQASYISSHLQQLAGEFRVEHLSIASRCIAELKKLNPVIQFNSPSNTEFEVSLIAFSDASQGKFAYVQTGYIGGIYFEDNTNTFHLLDFYSGKQTRVSFSSIGAGIIAAATSSDRAYLMRLGLSSLFSSSNPLPLVLAVDSHGFYGTITTLHEGKDYRLRPTISRLRDSFESREITCMQWIPGHINIEDALTKRNISIFQTLNKVASSQILPDLILAPAEMYLKNNTTR